MSRLTIVVVAACSAPPRVQPPRAPPPVPDVQPAPPDLRARNAARQRADDALRTDLALEYQRPFKPYVPPDRSATAALFASACKDGDTHACIVEAQLRPLDVTGTAYQTVLANCMAGDTMSCRALPPDDAVARFPGARGAASRTERCQHERASCDVQDLRRECEEGFPAACLHLNGKLTDDVPEGHDALDRFIVLTRDGCRHDIASECEISDGDEANRIEMAQRACNLRPETCANLADHEERHGDKAAARLHRERACQYGKDYLGVCIELAEKYLSGELDEPVPGRAQALLDWACPKLIKLHGPSVLERSPACKSAKRP